MAKWVLGAILGLLIVNSGVQLGIGLSRHLPDPDVMTGPSFDGEDMKAAERLYVEPQTEREKQIKKSCDMQLSVFVRWMLNEAGGDMRDRKLLIRSSRLQSVIDLVLLALAVAAWIACIRTCRRATAPRPDTPPPGATAPPRP
ncbi:MAG: hypothetical protein A3K19_05785 [Lentisphaerae bacterium RIFOXYB12_FULL_65_16]|nr:MAG: hypothetical protein A3K18_15400 [Lentisphaerae bacterium RIFOXYA12_64_32]OGV95083.1 MAG: hypothetical protein A3K19_05785 [Lentisphaerae bacterium RIFOXYB12_FULL_65_16]